MMGKEVRFWKWWLYNHFCKYILFPLCRPFIKIFHKHSPPLHCNVQPSWFQLIFLIENQSGQCIFILVGASEMHLDSAQVTHHWRLTDQMIQISVNLGRLTKKYFGFGHGREHFSHSLWEWSDGYEGSGLGVYGAYKRKSELHQHPHYSSIT